MKKFITVLLCLSSFSFGQNGDFESWTGGLPDNWTTIGSGITVIEETSVVYGSNSSASINLTTETQVDTDFRQNFDVTNGMIYNFSVFIYHTDGGVRVRLYIDGFQTYSDPDTTGGWQEVTSSYTATADETIEIGLRFYDKAPAFDGAEIIYIDDFTVNNGALPVELTTFSTLIVDNNVVLNWETATEVNNYGFNVERKYITQIASNLSDTWAKIGFIEGNGNSNSPKYYSYTDNAIEASGKYLYRLKQIDIDGSFEYSDVVEVNLGTPQVFELKQNFPNPFNPTTSIQFNLPQDGHVRLSVFNIVGEEVRELLNNNIAAGYHSVNFDASSLNSGLYLYKIEAGNFVQIRKMMLVK